MARLNLEEQEQISKLAYFWRDYGKYIIGIIIVVIVAYSSNEVYQWKTKEKAAQAAEIYSKLEKAALKNDAVITYNLASQMQAEYPKIEYTTFANMMSAKVAFAHKDLDKASIYLNLVIKSSKDKYLVDIARLRLADVYIDQKKTKEAMDRMQEKTVSELMPLYHEKMGDLYFIMNEKIKAHNSYKIAMGLATGSPDLAQAIQMKLDALGN